MKSNVLNLFIVLLFISLTSCKKDYVCICTTTADSVDSFPETWSDEYKEHTTAKKAAENCNARNDALTGSTGSRITTCVTGD